MALDLNAADNYEVSRLLAADSYSATAAAGTGVDVLDYDGALQVSLDAEAASGTNPELDVIIEESDALASGYTAVTGAAFTTVDDTAGGSLQTLKLDRKALKRYIRASFTLTGGGACVFSVLLRGRKKYQR